MTENFVKTKHESIMLAAKSRLSAIAKVIDGRVIDYVDVPVYENAGDLLIMLGTRRFFEANNIRVRGLYTFFNYRAKDLKSDVAIVFQGGGNFGDLYEGPQNIRSHCIQKFKENRIVILPQTIHFENIENFKKCCALYRQHKDLHIFVRDAESYKLASQMTDNVYLSPDMAHHLWPYSALQRPGKGVLAFIRTDDESKNKISFPDNQINLQTDWPEFLLKYKLKVKIIHYLLVVSSRFKFSAKIDQFLMSRWIELAEVICSDAANLFSKYSLIITDRLHGHILACLVSRKNILHDNSYGKNSNYSSSWTVASDIVEVFSKKS